MHREIKIKQFPIVTTHWWPKTRNKRFVWETNSIYIVFYLLCITMSKWSECTHIRCVTCVCARALARRRQRLMEGVSEAWCWRNFSSANGGISQSDRLMQIPEKYVIGCCNYDGASAPRFRHALRQALTPTSQSARTHTRHTPDVCALRSLGHGYAQEVKNDINTVRFLTQTACFVS